MPNASDGLPARESGIWVLDKKYYFQRYLDIFTRGVKAKWSGKLAYVDLFCGPGVSILRENNREIEGSPILSLQYDFARYVFVDVPEILGHLEKRIEHHPKRRQIEMIPGDCNKEIEKVLLALPKDHLTLVFIDPTGLQIFFRTIQRLVCDRHLDLLMTLQTGMGIRMNLQQYFRTDGVALTEFLGNSDWRIDCREGGTDSQVTRRIIHRYMKQLEQLGFITVRDREIEVKVDDKLLLYYMVLATRHPRGEDFWRKATEIGPSGQRMFDY